MPVTFTVNLRGAPLRRTYVSHFDFFRTPQTLFFRTNDTGEVTVANAGRANVTLDPTGPNGTITVSVYAQNSVVRVLDGNFPIPVEVKQDFTVANGGTININTDAEKQDHFRIMDACLVVYHTVFRQFSPFRNRNRGDFPFGQAGSIEATRNRLPRIEVVYPDNSPAAVAFVEPVSVGTGYPLIHIKNETIDRRLFGDPRANPPIDATLIPHELAHALYFALMSGITRRSVEVQYMGWITGRIASGLPPFHNTDIATTPFVAWIESLGLFSERFFFFRNRLNPPLSGLGERRAFPLDELATVPLLEATNLTGFSQVGHLDTAGNVVPDVTEDNVEGAVYGAIFLDFARRVGLRNAVDQYLRSSDNNVLTFDDFRNLIITEDAATNPPRAFGSEITQAANTWRL